MNEIHEESNIIYDFDASEIYNILIITIFKYKIELYLVCIIILN